MATTRELLENHWESNTLLQIPWESTFSRGKKTCPSGINEKALKKSRRNTSIPILRPNTLVTFVAPVEPLPMLCKFSFAKNFVII